MATLFAAHDTPLNRALWTAIQAHDQPAIHAALALGANPALRRSHRGTGRPLMLDSLLPKHATRIPDWADLGLTLPDRAIHTLIERKDLAGFTRLVHDHPAQVRLGRGVATCVWGLLCSAKTQAKCAEAWLAPLLALRPFQGFPDHPQAAWGPLTMDAIIRVHGEGLAQQLDLADRLLDHAAYDHPDDVLELALHASPTLFAHYFNRLAPTPAQVQAMWIEKSLLWSADPVRVLLATVPADWQTLAQGVLRQVPVATQHRWLAAFAERGWLSADQVADSYAQLTVEAAKLALAHGDRPHLLDDRLNNLAGIGPALIRWGAPAWARPHDGFAHLATLLATSATAVGERPDRWQAWWDAVRTHPDRPVDWRAREQAALARLADHPVIQTWRHRALAERREQTLTQQALPHHPRPRHRP